MELLNLLLVVPLKSHIVLWHVITATAGNRHDFLPCSNLLDKVGSEQRRVLMNVGTDAGDKGHHKRCPFRVSLLASIYHRQHYLPSKTKKIIGGSDIYSGSCGKEIA